MSAATQEPLVSLHGVTVTVAGRALLDSVDATVSSREIVTVLGPNGAGKTTLVKVVLGLLEPSRGEVVRRPGIRLGYVPQAFAVDPTLPLSVRGYLQLAGAPRGTDLGAALVEVGLEDLLARPMTVLSGGEQRRVQLARALLRAPDLLVLDEPLSGVDLAGQQELYRLIADIRDRRGCGILLVSHDLHLVMAATDRVLCLDGHVCCSGRPHEIADDPAFRRLLGEPVQPALALYRHHHDHAHHHAHHVGTSGEPR